MIADLLQSQPLFWVALAALVGLVVGSFLNVVVHRLPRMMQAEWADQCAELRGETPAARPRYNLWVPRSACPSCGHVLTALENIPLLSWLALRGRCSACQAPISARYPLVEFLTAALSAAVAWKFGFGATVAAALVFVWALVAAAFIDLDTTLLPDSITQPLLWLGLLVNLDGLFTSLPSAVIGAAAGYLVLWSVYWLFKLVTGKEGMGYGDFKLLAAIGAWLGWQMLPVTLLLSSLVGAVVGVAMIVFLRHDRRVPIPFGPYLAGGGVVALLFGDVLTRNYLAAFS